MFFSPSREQTAHHARTVAAPAHSRRAIPGEAGAYFTDGRILYQVLAPLHWAERRGFALLEDCRSLDVTAFTSQELAAAALRPVEPRTAPTRG